MPQRIARQIATLRSELEARPEGLVRHVRRVLEEALQLASYWDVDPQRTELAVWGHDLYRSHSPAEQLQLAREAGLRIEATDEASPVLLHGPVAAEVLRHRFHIADDEVLAAVRDHTLGRATMPLLAKVILLADKVESRKRERAPVLRDIRLLARRDLDRALLCWADWKWVEERVHGWQSHPAHWEARREWMREHHVDAGLPGRVSGREFSRE